MGAGRPAARRVRRRRALRVHQRLRAALRDARRGRRARCAEGGPRALPPGLRPGQERRRGRRHDGERRGREPAVVARRDVLGVHRGPPPRAPRGRAHEAGAGHLPRRVDPRGHQRRAHVDLPVRRRPGDDRPPAGRRAQAPGRAPRHPGAAACGQEPDPGVPRRGAAGREPGEDRLPPGQALHHGGGRRHQGRHPGHAAQRRRQPRPAAVRVPERVPDRPAERPGPHRVRRGAHSCPGGPLARVEGRVSLERILDRMHDIRLSEEHHGPAGARRFDYEPTWILRGLKDVHLEFDPVDAPRTWRGTDEPGRRRHRWGLGHRPRRRPPVRGRRSSRRHLRP